jgi:transketolase
VREAFSNSLVRLAVADHKVLLLTGDHGYALFDEFRKRCPDQYINAGIAEQNMVGMAAGLARVGFRPFVYGLAAFVPIRTLEQIKLDIAHDNLPVVLLGDGAGFVYSHLGTSHQSTEDIACARAIPNLKVLSPADRFEMTASMAYAYAANGPVYLRMGKSDRGDVHNGDFPIVPGHLVLVKAGTSGGETLIATGSMVCTALEVARELLPQANVWSAPLIKPLDVEHLVDICRGSRAVITMEEHSTLGGLGSLIAEVVSERGLVRLLRIGVPDRFSEHCGRYDYLLSEHGLDRVSVGAKVCAFLETL